MRRRILLVDDNVAVSLTLKALLEENEFTVETAASAAEAIEKMASGIYQLVITDARMENENAAFEVVRSARRQAYNPATALLTADSPQDSWKDDGVQSLLVKPLGTEDLLRQIEALLILREDALHKNEEGVESVDEKLPPQPTLTLGRRAAGSTRQGRRNAS